MSPNRLASHLKPLDSAEGLVPKATVTENQIAINDRIFFAPGASAIRPSSHTILDRVAAALIDRPDIEEVSIQGHTARSPSGDINLALSVQRAKAVVDYLVSKGVDRERISSIGFGQTRPDGDSDNRVEFVIEKWAKNRVMPAEASVQPDATTADTTGSLLIENEHSYEATVAVNGTVIGTLGPYTDAAIHGLKTGLYDVRFTHTSGYSAEGRSDQRGKAPSFLAVRPPQWCCPARPARRLRQRVGTCGRCSPQPCSSRCDKTASVWGA